MKTTSDEKPTKLSILFVDDERAVLKSLERFARSKNWNTYTALSGEEALIVLENKSVDIIVTDMCMPGMDGAELLERVKESHPKTVRILLTGFSDVLSLEAAINRGGIFNYLSKPWDDLLLAEMIGKAFEYRSHEKERERLQKENRKQFKKLGVLALSLDKMVKERSMETEQALTLLTNLHDQTNKKYRNTLNVIKMALGWRYPAVAKKLAFVEEFSSKMADIIDITSQERETLMLTSQYYLIGALSLPEELCNKPFFQLKPEEINAFTKCGTLSGQLLKESEAPLEAVNSIEHCFDSLTGVNPQSKADIANHPISSKVIRVINDFYEFSQGRLVMNSYGKLPAIVYINKHVGEIYDETITKAFCELAMKNTTPEPSAISIDIEHLSIDMELAEDVYSLQGAVLLTKGMALTERHIQLLVDQQKQSKKTLYVEIAPQ